MDAPVRAALGARNLMDSGYSRRHAVSVAAEHENLPYAEVSGALEMLEDEAREMHETNLEDV